MSCRLYPIFVLLLSMAACQKKDDNVVIVDKDDQAMNAAMQKARSTVKQFIAALKSPKPGQSQFSVKMGFKDGDNVEYMWLSPVSFNGRAFEGTVNNEPELVKTVKIGQTVTVEPSKISDWMYVHNRKLVGGETIRVLRDRLSPAERAEFDKKIQFVFE